MTSAPDSARPGILVTGGAGFIGSALCERLLARGQPVIAYDDFSRGHREILPEAVQVVSGDIRDGGRFTEALTAWKPNCVVHLAAMHFIPDCIAQPHLTMEINVDGTRRVLDSCRGSSVRHVIFASSAAVYAPTDDPCVEDETPLRPLEVYGESKLEGERLVSAFHAETGIAATTLRLFNAIGRRETNPHVVPHIFESLRTSDAINLGNITPRRDYIDTREVAAAVEAAAHRSVGHRVFNVGTGVTYSVQDILERLSRILGRPISAVQDASRLRTTERMVLAADINKIRRETSWSPGLSLDDTLRDLVAAYGLESQPHSAT